MHESIKHQYLLSLRLSKNSKVMVLEVDLETGLLSCSGLFMQCSDNVTLDRDGINHETVNIVQM